MVYEFEYCSMPTAYRPETWYTVTAYMIEPEEFMADNKDIDWMPWGRVVFEIHAGRNSQKNRLMMRAGRIYRYITARLFRPYIKCKHFILKVIGYIGYWIWKCFNE